MAFLKVKECLTNPTELVKLILLLVCVCITIYQVSESLNKVLHPPITSYYKFRYNDSIKYPALTVCRRPCYKKELFYAYGMRQSISDLSSQDAFKGFKFNQYSIEEFLNATTYPFQETILIYGFKGAALRDNVYITQSFHPQRGLCQTIVPKETVDSFSINTGYYLYLKHTTEDKSKDTNGLSTSGFEIHIHNEFDVIREQIIDTSFLYLESAEDMRVTLTVQTYSQISTEKQPCNSDHTYSKSKCEEKCLHNIVAKKVGCKVPWLKQLVEELEECNNSSSINKIGNFINLYGKKEFLESCQCPISCNNSVYKYQIESRRDSDPIQAPSSTISIYFPSNVVTDLTEVISYDWNMFLSDVGGSLGFLLGLSVIGCVNILESIIKIVFKKANHRKLSTSVVDSVQTVEEFVSDCDSLKNGKAEVNDSKY